MTMRNAECGMRDAQKKKFTHAILHPAPRIPHSAWRFGQSTLEYAMFVAAVSAAVVTMSVYVRRAVQANFKALENAINAEVEVH